MSLRATVLLLVSLTACQTWTRVPGKPADAIAATNPGKVRLHTSDGRVMELTAVRVVGDSAVGFDAHDVRVALLLTRIARIERPHATVDVGTYDRKVTNHDPPIGH